ncbi:MAG: hypothetical protein QOE29_2232 [Gaiellaceae bacterium]|jgi:uncharacterized membrane-anchored protein|nr:hypothetical protein [Gaiellaceae bacterium]
MAATLEERPPPAPGKAPRFTSRTMLNKVPEVTLYFWIIKILATTVGETAADYLNGTLGFGLTNTTWVMGAALVAALIVQFRLQQYVPAVYWLAVVLISIVGTLITDNLTDNFGVSLVTTTIGFGIALALTFGAWYRSERTLSIHTIYTTRREAFYWLTVLFTFALGTAAGDLTAERLAVGYWKSALLFGALIGIVFALHVSAAKLNAILAFWVAYILTRPLGASIGDFLSQPRADGGRGLGTTATSFIFLGTILTVVVFLTITRRDRIETHPPAPHPDGVARRRVLVVANKTAASPALLDAVRARAAAEAAEFFVLIPNPNRLAFDRNSEDVHEGEQILALALPLLRDATGEPVEGRVSSSPNAYDDIVEELGTVEYAEVILSTLPAHVSHWLHIDLPARVAELGYPITTVTP